MLLYSDVNPFKADIWALGITFFFMATGKFPFDSPSREKLELLILKSEINFTKFDIDPRIQFLLKKMLAKYHSDRPDAEKLLELPMFNKKILNDKLLGKFEISGRRIQSCFNMEKVNPIDIKKIDMLIMKPKLKSK